MPEIASFPWWLTLAIQIALGAGAAAALDPDSRARRALMWILVCVGLALPWITSPEPRIGRFLVALGGALVWVHCLDLSCDRRRHSPWARIWFVLTPFDTRAVRRVRPRLRHGLAVLGWAIAAAAGFWLVQQRVSSHAAWALRWGGGLVACYALAEVAASGVTQGYLAFGREPPPMHRTPMLARTIQEFWGERWNLEVRRLLYSYAFRPLVRRRGLTTALIVTFLVSAVGHAWLMLPAGGVALAGVWGLFFIIHGMLMALERRLGVARWRRPFAHAWTVSMFVLTSPLFVEPMLRILPGVPAPP